MGTLLAACFRSRWASLACLAVVVLALVLPAGGFGIPMCQFRTITGFPCIGCGLTRSFIRMAHLDVARAGFYHPAGLILFPVVAFIAALLVVPSEVRARLAGWAERHPRPLNAVGWAALALAILYGIGRMVWLLRTGQPSPW